MKLLVGLKVYVECLAFCWLKKYICDFYVLYDGFSHCPDNPIFDPYYP